MLLSIVIPVFSEAETVLELLRRVVPVDLPGLYKGVILVDDGPSDGSFEL